MRGEEQKAALLELHVREVELATRRIHRPQAESVDIIGQLERTFHVTTCEDVADRIDLWTYPCEAWTRSEVPNNIAGE
jgi:hypothetical protein